MSNKKYILDKIKSGPIFKHFERDYSVFFISAMGDTHVVANQPKYGNNGLSLAIMTFRDNVSCYYRLEKDNDVYLQNIANNIAKEKGIKDEIFKKYSEAGDNMQKLYAKIDEQEIFEPEFILELAKNINRLIPYQILILQRADSFVKAFERTPEIPNEIYAIRKKYESVFGSFETKFELLCNKIIKSLSLNMVLSDFKLLTSTDIIQVMQTRLKPIELINKRSTGVVVSYLPQLEILVDSDAQEILDAIYMNEDEYYPTKDRSKTISGKIVFGTGKIIGKCRIVTDYKKINDLMEGEILVVPSTLPKYNDVYKRARAIITNEGGVLAHASIFCREFNIPGMVGTKIATKVLKDGDIVEVDADNGIVRIIK